MNLKQLETFVTVVESKSFTKAAKKLFITQPAVSFQIKALEEELGIKLLDRLEQEICLTDGGKILFEEATTILSSYQEVITGIDKLKNLEVGSLKIGASTIPGEYIMPYILGDFVKEYPNIEVGLRIGSSKQVADWLRERAIDVGITGIAYKGNGLKSISFLEDELVLIAGKKNAEVIEQELTIQDLVNFKIILREQGSGTRAAVEKILADHGIKISALQVMMELGTTRAVLTAVSAGLGISFVSKWAARDLVQLGKLQQLNLVGVDLKRELYLLSNENAYVSVIANCFNQFIKKRDIGKIFK
ncbi:MAG: selenium metabolism-associated LysR family transcriptional regulator [Bacillota bacterium]|nr:selenium metabolism-associated LysR family transcriptional regulator [Bacillota bacterium]